MLVVCDLNHCTGATIHPLVDAVRHHVKKTSFFSLPGLEISAIEEEESPLKNVLPGGGVLDSILLDGVQTYSNDVAYHLQI